MLILVCVLVVPRYFGQANFANIFELSDNCRKYRILRVMHFRWTDHEIIPGTGE